ncbi:hypothetical protein [Clostridium sp.]|uniref:hypothetical protein n=1 Tax=Clostridium sp. TaxID=1506 RepID=UPI0029010114|nr:hypothetical protein [Clostridium sp.]MDU1181368.1 hypothetical protein [Clostridium sp.]
MMIRKNVQLSEYLADKLVKESNRIGVSQSSIVSIALDYYFSRMDNDKKIECKERPKSC